METKIESTSRLGFREFGAESNEGSIELHNPLSPLEVYTGERIAATVFVNSGQRNEIGSFNVVRISPLGIEMAVDSGAASNLRVNQEVDLRVHLAGNDLNFFGVTVATEYVSKGKRCLGIRLCQPERSEGETEEKRKFTRWLCGEYFLPTGVAANPARFNDFIFFSVPDISKKGMLIATSLRNKLLIPGMVLESSISFPMVGQLSLRLKITNARIKTLHGKDYLALGTEILGAGKEELETIGQYLLQFGPSLSAKELRESGFATGSVSSAVNYGFVKDLSGYRDVLQLRKDAYSAVEKADDKASLEDMSDVFDSKSRILTAIHQGRMVASSRLTFHGPDELNEYDQFVELPERDFPRRDEIVVLSRICTHPSYRGSDLFFGLMRHTLLTALQSKRRYLLGGCQDSLLKLYEKVGFRGTGLYFEHGGLKGNREQIIIADSIGILTGRDVSAGVWNEIYSDLSVYLSQKTDHHFDPKSNLRLAIYRAVSPFTRVLTQSVRRPRRK